MRSLGSGLNSRESLDLLLESLILNVYSRILILQSHETFKIILDLSGQGGDLSYEIIGW